MKKAKGRKKKAEETFATRFARRLTPNAPDGAGETVRAARLIRLGLLFRTRAAEDAAHDIVISLMARELLKVVLR